MLLMEQVRSLSVDTDVTGNVTQQDIPYVIVFNDLMASTGCNYMLRT